MSDAIRVSGIHIYPVKSLRGYPVDQAVVEARGFRWDRRFMVVTPAGDFVSQRECHAMAPISARIEGDHLVLRRGDESDVAVPAKLAGKQAIPVRVWDSRIMAEPVSRRVDRWLSSALDRDVRLVVMPETTHRLVDPAYDTGGDIVSFADGYPYLVIGDASLDALNDRLDLPVPMERFRPNLTLGGGRAFEEDEWTFIRVGPVVFQNVKPCARCVVTTIDPETGTAGHEPLATLADFRKRNGSVYMGMNLVPRGSGVVRVGDPVVGMEGRDGSDELVGPWQDFQVT